jgi:hypothetical protein
MTWTTRLRPELTRPFDVEEMHNVWFIPKEWPGKGAVASLLIPECEMHLCMLGPDGAPVTFVNRPKANKKVEPWVRTVCELANERGAAVSFSCDTAEQAEKGLPAWPRSFCRTINGRRWSACTKPTAVGWAA